MLDLVDCQEFFFVWGGGGGGGGGEGKITAANHNCYLVPCLPNKLVLLGSTYTREGHTDSIYQELL